MKKHNMVMYTRLFFLFKSCHVKRQLNPSNGASHMQEAKQGVSMSSFPKRICCSCTCAILFCVPLEIAPMPNSQIAFWTFYFRCNWSFWANNFKTAMRYWEETIWTTYSPIFYILKQGKKENTFADLLPGHSLQRRNFLKGCLDKVICP